MLRGDGRIELTLWIGDRLVLRRGIGMMLRIGVVLWRGGGGGCEYGGGGGGEEVCLLGVLGARGAHTLENAHEQNVGRQLLQTYLHQDPTLGTS